jgi:hypothetical protein
VTGPSLLKIMTELPRNVKLKRRWQRRVDIGGGGGGGGGETGFLELQAKSHGKILV